MLNWDLYQHMILQTWITASQGRHTPKYRSIGQVVSERKLLEDFETLTYIFFKVGHIDPIWTNFD